MRQFCECFVHWTCRFHTTFALLIGASGAADSAHQGLGLRALRIATNPHVLSGRSAYAAARHYTAVTCDATFGFLARCRAALKLCESANRSCERRTESVPALGDSVATCGHDVSAALGTQYSDIEGKLGSTPMKCAAFCTLCNCAGQSSWSRDRTYAAVERRVRASID